MRSQLPADKGMTSGADALIVDQKNLVAFDEAGGITGLWWAC